MHTQEEPRRVSAVGESGSDDEQYRSGEVYFIDGPPLITDKVAIVENKLSEFKYFNLIKSEEERIEELKNDFESYFPMYAMKYFSLTIEQLKAMDQQEKRILAEKLYDVHRQKYVRLFMNKIYWWKWLPLLMLGMILYGLYAMSTSNFRTSIWGHISFILGVLSRIFLGLVQAGTWCADQPFSKSSLSYCNRYEELSKYNLIFPDEQKNLDD